MVVNPFNPSTQETGEGESLELMAGLVATAAQRDPGS